MVVFDEPAVQRVDYESDVVAKMLEELQQEYVVSLWRSRRDSSRPHSVSNTQWDVLADDIWFGGCGLCWA